MQAHNMEWMHEAHKKNDNYQIIKQQSTTSVPSKNKKVQLV